jgi:hypothetical protein
MNTYQKNIKLRDDMLSGQQDVVKTYIMFVDDLEHLKEESLKMKAFILKRFENKEYPKNLGYKINEKDTFNELLFRMWADNFDYVKRAKDGTLAHGIGQDVPIKHHKTNEIMRWVDRPVLSQVSTKKRIFKNLLERGDSLADMSDTELEDLIIECDMWHKC